MQVCIYLIELLEELELLVGLHLELRPVLAVALELVNELIHHVPQPLVGELHVDDPVKDNPEEAAVVVPALHPLPPRGSQPRVHVAEPHLSVEEAEHVVVVHVGGHGVHRRPRRLAKHPVAELLERGLVHLVDLVDVLLANVTVEVDHERLHGVGHEVRVVGEIRLGLGLLAGVEGVVVLVARHYRRRHV